MVPIQILSAMLNEHQVSEPENLEAGEGSAEFLALFEDAPLPLGEGPQTLPDIQHMAIEQPPISIGSSVNITPPPPEGGSDLPANGMGREPEVTQPVLRELPKQEVARLTPPQGSGPHTILTKAAELTAPKLSVRIPMEGPQKQGEAPIPTGSAQSLPPIEAAPMAEVSVINPTASFTRPQNEGVTETPVKGIPPTPRAEARMEDVELMPPLEKPRLHYKPEPHHNEPVTHSKGQAPVDDKAQTNDLLPTKIENRDLLVSAPPRQASASAPAEPTQTQTQTQKISDIRPEPAPPLRADPRQTVPVDAPTKTQPTEKTTRASLLPQVEKPTPRLDLKATAQRNPTPEIPHRELPADVVFSATENTTKAPSTVQLPEASMPKVERPTTLHPALLHQPDLAIAPREDTPDLMFGPVSQAGSVTAPSAPTVTATPPAQIMSQIASAVMPNSTPITHDQVTEIALDPPELGRVRMILSQMDSGLISMTVIADRPETLDLLRRNADLLAQEFAQSGLAGSEFSFQGGGQNKTAGHGDMHRADAPSALAEPSESPASPLPQSKTNGLDLRL